MCLGRRPPGQHHSGIPVYTHTLISSGNGLFSPNWLLKNQNLFFLSVGLRVKNPFQITSQYLSMKPPLVHGNLGYLMEWDTMITPSVYFLFWINRSFLRALLVVWSLAVTLLKNVSYKGKSRISTFQSPFCLFSFLIIWSTLKAVQGPLT